MTAIDVISLEDLTFLDEEHPHIACCRADAFVCGRPFHPELVATDAVPEDECCPTCIEIMYQMLCPAWRPTHAHCGLNPLKICPE